jgi:putative Holliday junction resolvase
MPPRLVGVDFGLQRVGIAVADPLRIFATPLGTFGRKEAIKRLVDLHAAEVIETIVLGWPVLLDGSEGETTRLVSKFQRQLEGALPDVSIVRLDERYTSKMARRAIHEAGGKRSAREKKGRVDAAAAAILLQSYLDAGRGSEDAPSK